MTVQGQLNGGSPDSQSERNEPVPVVTWQLVHALQVQEAASLKTVSEMPSQFW